MLKVGDIVTRAPVSFAPTDDGEPGKRKHSGKGVKKPTKCRVVYVHPLGRYHVVEFKTRGGAVRESYKGVEEYELPSDEEDDDA